MILLLILLFPSWLWAAQPAPSKDVITTGSKPYPVGTTKDTSFQVPTENIGRYGIFIPCDASLHVVVRLEDDKGKGYGSFTRSPGTCGKLVKVGGYFTRPPIEEGTNLNIRITNNGNASITKQIDIEFLK